MEHLLGYMEKELIGQRQNIRLLVAALLAGGHVLLEGVPGIGKTKMVRTLSHLIGGESKRVQFTPDMMPSDIIGHVVFNMQLNHFETIKGPIFANLLLADEINRTAPKTQAALLEAMEEHQVTIQGVTYPLPEPFFVVATQNPVEYEGTYILPEAQLDRFLFKLNMQYPSYDHEKQILKQHLVQAERLGALPLPIYSMEDILIERQKLNDVVVDDSLVDYITTLIRKTRETTRLQLGASSRAGIAVLQASKAWALLDNRMYVTPDDVKTVARPALRHRLILSPQVELEGGTSDQIIDETLAAIPVPR
ncbi:magnesium chelatase [Brevibacillus choshinensis]|uniref:Magnesium chelatase n=1 Tax=Brevibacillus choshinensis TaxID=54911 RepID=A0ABR5N1B5_BRECH|nr:MoxR family ATPase [Brevibacillus choshinensis]KQL44294.1 magnesium chelatase [Brevibacillus choshinensis]